MVEEGVIDFEVLVCGVETLPGAGGGAVLSTLSTEVGILPDGGGGGGEADLDSFWEGTGFLPMNGAGAVFTVVGLGVVVVFFGAEVAALGVEVTSLFITGVFGGGRGGSGFALTGLVGGGFFATPEPSVLAAVVAIVVVVAAVVGFAVVGL